MRARSLWIVALAVVASACSPMSGEGRGVLVIVVVFVTGVVFAVGFEVRGGGVARHDQ